MRLTLPAQLQQQYQTYLVDELQIRTFGKYDIPDWQQIVERELSGEEQPYPTTRTVSESDSQINGCRRTEGRSEEVAEVSLDGQPTAGQAELAGL